MIMNYKIENELILNDYKIDIGITKDKEDQIRDYDSLMGFVAK